MIVQLDAADILDLSSYGRPRPFPDYDIRVDGMVIRVPNGLTVQHLFRSWKAGNRIFPSKRWEEAASLKGGDFLFRFQGPRPMAYGEYHLSNEEPAPAAMIVTAQLCCHLRGLQDPLEGWSSWAAEENGGYRLVIGWASYGKIVPIAQWENDRPTYVGLATIRRLG